VTDTAYPRLLVTLGGVDSFRDPFEVDGESFVGIKSFKAIGKRITTLHIGKVEELEPIKTPPISPEEGEDINDESEVSPSEEDVEVPESTGDTEGAEETEGTLDPYEGKSQQDIEDEMNGQLRLDF
jgi:topoisomerase-4 subunit A